MGNQSTQAYYGDTAHSQGLSPSMTTPQQVGKKSRGSPRKDGTPAQARNPQPTAIVQESAQLDKEIATPTWLLSPQFVTLQQGYKQKQAEKAAIQHGKGTIARESAKRKYEGKVIRQLIFQVLTFIAIPFIAYQAISTYGKHADERLQNKLLRSGSSNPLANSRLSAANKRIEASRQATVLATITPYIIPTVGAHDSALTHWQDIRNGALAYSSALDAAMATPTPLPRRLPTSVVSTIHKGTPGKDLIIPDPIQARATRTARALARPTRVVRSRQPASTPTNEAQIPELALTPNQADIDLTTQSQVLASPHDYPAPTRAHPTKQPAQVPTRNATPTYTITPYVSRETWLTTTPVATRSRPWYEPTPTIIP